LRRLNKLYGNEVFPGMILRLRSNTSGKTPPDSTGVRSSTEPKREGFSSSFRMATKPHDSLPQDGNKSLLAATKGPASVFFSFASGGNSGSGHGSSSSGGSGSAKSTGGIVGSFLAGSSSSGSNSNGNNTSSSGSSSSGSGSSGSTKLSWKSGTSIGKSFLPTTGPTVTEDYDSDAPHDADEEARARAASIEATLPVLLGEGKVLRMDFAVKLRRLLPPRLQIENWRLLYSVLNDGADLNSFFARVVGCKYTILIVETINGEIFGGFNAAEWSISPNFCKYHASVTTLHYTALHTTPHHYYAPMHPTAP
jgi:hypothetical protein